MRRPVVDDPYRKYGSDTLVVFYETFQSSYRNTRIGRIPESSGLAKALGPGSQRITFTVP